MLNNLVGPCGASLIGIGKSRFVMFASFSMVILNFALNAALIPFFAIIGAAIATMSSSICINIIQSLKLYSIIRAISISKNLVKPMFVSLVLFILFYLILQNFLDIRSWMVLIILVIFYFIFLMSLLFTKSLDKEDLQMLQILEAKTGRKSKIFRRLILRFQ